MHWRVVLISMALAATVAAAQDAEDQPDADQERLVVSADALDAVDSQATIDEALGRQHDTFLVKGTIKTALQHLSGLSGIRIEVDWNGLAEIGVTKETPVLLRTDGQTTRRIIELLLAQASPERTPIAWRVDGNVVRISSQAVIAATTAADEPRSRRQPTAAPLDLTFDQAPLEDALAAIAQTAGVPMHVSWRALLVSGIVQDTPVSVEVEGLTLMTMLDLIIEDASADRDKFASIYWYIEDGIVRITTGRAMNERLITRTFDIGDMLIEPPDFVGPRVDMSYVQGDSGPSGSIFTESDQEEESAAERRHATKDAIVETVTALLDADMWDSGGGKGRVRIVGTQLIVSQTRLGYLLMDRRR